MTAWSREIERAENPPPHFGGLPAVDPDRISHYRALRDEALAAKPHKKPDKRKK
jgi:hypothetical protein